MLNMSVVCTLPWRHQTECCILKFDVHTEHDLKETLCDQFQREFAEGPLQPSASQLLQPQRLQLVSQGWDPLPDYVSAATQ